LTIEVDHKPKRSAVALSFIALMVFASVLRPPVAAIGPLLPEISADLSLNLGAQGLLTAIPVLCFGLGAFAGPAMNRRFGLDRSLLILSVIIFVAVLMRGWLGFGVMLIGTAVAGLAIAVANVLLPSVVRLRFPNRVAPVTAAYTTVLAIAASGASATAVPLSAWLGGWNPALLIWAVPGLLAIILWILQSRNRLPHVRIESAGKASRAVWRSSVTWSIVTFFGIQSLTFYAILAWMPSVLIERGLSPQEAGGILGLTAIVGVPIGIVLGANFSKFRRSDILGFAISLFTLAGFVLLLVPGAHLASAIFLGLGMASTFPLSLNWISTRAPNASQTTQLSAISQGFGYLLSAIGTFVFGLLREVSGSWDLPILLLVVLTLVQALSSFIAGGRKHIPAD
jgi:CP family cyanate transporter-like MFS transporter